MNHQKHAPKAGETVTMLTTIQQLGVLFLELGVILWSIAPIALALDPKGSAELYRFGSNQHVIEQSGGGKARVTIQRYPHGQTILRRDGANTDITIQRSAPLSRSATMAPWSSPATDGANLNITIQRADPVDRGNFCPQQSYIPGQGFHRGIEDRFDQGRFSAQEFETRFRQRITP